MFEKLLNEEFNKFFREKFTKNRFMPEMEILKEEGIKQVSFPDFRKIMPTIKITEAWGKIGNADRGVIEKFTAALGGKNNSVHAKLNRINDIVTGNKEDYTLSELLTVMVVIETLGAILQEFTESAGGFIFEGFLAGLFGGKSVQIERPEDLPEADDETPTLQDAPVDSINESEEADETDDEEQAGKPITDVVLEFKDESGRMQMRHYSLKLLGPGTDVKGSFRNMVKHFKSFDHVVYLDARVTDGRTRMKFSEFEITLERFLKVFYEPFKRMAPKAESFGDLASLKAKLAQIESGEEEYLRIKFAGRPPLSTDLQTFGISVSESYKSTGRIFNRSEMDARAAAFEAIEVVSALPDAEDVVFGEETNLPGYVDQTRTNRQQATAKNRLTALKERIANMFPVEVTYSAESFEKSVKGKKYFGTKNKMEQIKRNIKELVDLRARPDSTDEAVQAKRASVVALLEDLPAYIGKEQFEFSENQVQSIADHRIVGPPEGLVVGPETLRRIWLQYGDTLRSTIEPVYRNLNEFTSNINSYFLAPSEGSEMGRLQHGERAITDAIELHTATDKVVRGMGDPGQSRLGDIEKAAEFNLRGVTGQGQSIRESKKKNKK